MQHYCHAVPRTSRSLAKSYTIIGSSLYINACKQFIRGRRAGAENRLVPCGLESKPRAKESRRHFPWN